MPNEPNKAKEDRSEPPKRHNDQTDHEGSGHDPSEFDSQNAAKQVGRPGGGNKK